MSDGNVRFKFKSSDPKRPARKKKSEVVDLRIQGKLTVVSPFYCRMYSFYEGDE
jgi:hypothetical protein